MNSTERNMLLENLRNGTFCRVAPSELGGVGVHAIRTIPKGVNPFPTVYQENTDSVDITPKEVAGLPDSVQTLIKDFFMRNPKGNFPVLTNGLNSMNISYYLNHDDLTPNLEMVDTGENYYSFQTNRRIEEGEELKLDYLQHCKTEKDRSYFGRQFNI